MGVVFSDRHGVQDDPLLDLLAVQKFDRLAQPLYGALKLAIVTGELPPEAPIDKIELYARFGVCRLSVTTAVNRLAFERLVVVEPQRGSYVSRIRISDVRQCMMVRRALEVEVVGACVDRTRRLLLPEPGRMPATLKEHQAIYRTIADRNPSAAARTMHTHLDRVLRELEVFQERHPNFFTD